MDRHLVDAAVIAGAAALRELRRRRTLGQGVMRLASQGAAQQRAMLVLLWAEAHNLAQR